MVGFNIGRNKEVANDDAIENYLQCLDLVHPVADSTSPSTVSSPNTLGLRDLQRADTLNDLLAAVRERNDVLNSGLKQSEAGTQKLARPLLVKVPPIWMTPRSRRSPRLR